MKFGMNKRDFIAIGIVIAACFLSFFLINRESEQGATAEVYIDGRLYASYPLDRNTKEKLPCDSGYNILVIKDSYAYISDADCPDKYCVSQGKIHNSGSSLVCLPHRLVVEIKADNAEQDIDAVAK